jgi:hypothetical protein
MSSIEQSARCARKDLLHSPRPSKSRAESTTTWPVVSSLAPRPPFLCGRAFGAHCNREFNPSREFICATGAPDGLDSPSAHVSVVLRQPHLTRATQAQRAPGQSRSIRGIFSQLLRPRTTTDANPDRRAAECRCQAGLLAAPSQRYTTPASAAPMIGAIQNSQS